MGLDSAIYRIVLLLHIATAIVGFGGLVAHGAYNAKAFASKASEAVVLLKNTRAITNIAHYAIYALLAFGIILISLSDGAISMGAMWISASFVVWFLMVGAAHGLVKPTLAKMQDRAEAMDGDAILKDDPEIGELAKKLAMGEGLSQLLLLIALILMVWQPGS